LYGHLDIFFLRMVVDLVLSIYISLGVYLNLISLVIDLSQVNIAIDVALLLHNVKRIVSKMAHQALGSTSFVALDAIVRVRLRGLQSLKAGVKTVATGGEVTVQSAKVKRQIGTQLLRL